MVATSQNRPERLKVQMSREAELLQSCLRTGWEYVLNNTLPAVHDAAERAVASGQSLANRADAEMFLERDPNFQFFSWYSRHGQRLRYYGGEGLGIFDQIDRDKEAILEALNQTTFTAGTELELDDQVTIPNYLRWADFHQHRGGTWSERLDGVIYETARRLAFLTETGDRNIYKWSYDMIPEGSYDRVLDWGTGHGAGLMEWKRHNPSSEGHGVDLSGPCLEIAHRRAREEGLNLYFKQQDLEFLKYPDDHFDLAFHIFMFHEIPPKNLVAMLKEIYRVLKPGGRFCGPESCLSNQPEYLRAIQRSIPWLLDEVYFDSWHNFDLEYWAKEIGFSEVIIEPWSAAFATLEDDHDRQLNNWKYFQLVK